MTMIRIGEIAHCRCGDKGDIANVSLIPWKERDVELLREHVTEQFVADVFGPLVQGTVTRYELPGVNAWNFVLTKALGGGVSRSLNLDIHGKSWGCLLMDAEIDASSVPEND